MDNKDEIQQCVCQQDDLFRLERFSVVKWYVLSVACILFVTASLKIISVYKSQFSDDRMDPVLIFMRADVLVLAVAALEIIWGILLLVVKDQRKQSLMILWLSGLFLLYRLGLLGVGYSGPCHCFGKPQSWQDFHFFTSLNTIMKIVLAYLSIPSLLFLKFISKSTH